MRRAGPWRVLTRRPKNEASSGERRLPLENDDDWPRLLGRKISVRYRLRDDDHMHSEAIGVVASVADGRIGVFNKKGERVDIAIADIEAGKVFPTTV